MSADERNKDAPASQAGDAQPSGLKIPIELPFPEKVAATQTAIPSSVPAPQATAREPKGVSRKSQTVAAWERYIALFMHPSLVARGQDIVLRARVFIVIGTVTIVSALVMGVDHLIHGPVFQGVLLSVLACLGVVLLSLVRYRGWLELAGNVTASFAFLAVTGAVYIRGGAGAPGQFAYGLVPMLAVLTAGWRSGVVWSVVVFVELAVFAAIRAMGVHLAVQVPESSREFSDVVMAFVITATLAGFSFGYEWYRLATTRVREQAEAERAIAERERAHAEQLRANAEHEREHAVQEAQLLHAARLAAVGQLAAGVGHEINNPLSYITGNIEYAFALLDEPPAEELRAELHEVLTDALEGTRRVTRIVSDLSTFARHADEEERSIVLQGAIEVAVKMAQHQIRHRATLHLDLGEQTLVRADDTRLTQLFLNLLINAAQAIAPGNAGDNSISVRVKSTGREVTVEVSDSGVGIPADVLHRVTDPFFTTKGVGEGTGLGLSVCKNIAEQYEGRLEVHSVPGEGTTITIVLPTANPVTANAPLPAATPSAEPACARILAIDDEPVILRTLERSLRQHNVETVQSGREGLRRLESESYDVVLCDVMMPDLTGIAVYRELERAGWPVDKRFIFMSGGVFNATMARELEDLPAPVLKKPWTKRDLDATMAAMWAS